MFSIGIDLGGTKISSAIFSREGYVLTKDLVYLENRGGREAGGLIQEQVINLLYYARENNLQINGVGISVPEYIIRIPEEYGRQISPDGKIIRLKMMFYLLPGI